MSERLTRQAKRMCRQCFYRDSCDNSCQDGASIEEQNLRAKEKKCKRAAIQGGTFGFPSHEFDTVLGDMIHLESGDWIFEGRDYERTDEPGKPRSRGSIGGLVGKKIDVF